jgi:signal transduction histidine kinase
MFAFFILIYFPEQQQKTLLNNFNTEVQNLSNTVALGVRIALTDQNYEGVNTAMEFVEKNDEFVFVSMISDEEGASQMNFSRPLGFKVPDNVASSDSMIIKTAVFKTPTLSGKIILGMHTNAITASKKEIRNTSLFVCFIVLVVGVFIGFLLAKSISVPVLALRDAAIRVGEGDRSQQVKLGGRDEIGELGKAFNRMVNALAVAESERNVAQTQLIHAEKMASLGQMTAGIAHEIKNPLNFVNNFSSLSIELIDEYIESTDEEDKADILVSLKSNLGKIAHHGKRADSIVATMLQHSRGKSEEKVLTDLNALCQEYFDLSYHGMRANAKDFNCALAVDFAPNISKVPVIPQDLSRVILNLLNNAFYAVNDRSKKDGMENYNPQVKITTKETSNSIFISIRDNGGGIPANIKDKIFQPFFTTKPTGEGTGLGLSLSYDIITKDHLGKMSVESEVNNFTEFIIEIPVKS